MSSPLLEDIKNIIEGSVKATLKTAPGLKGRRALPLYLKPSEGINGDEELIDVVPRWITDRRSPIALLSAPIGGGKTIATCEFQRKFQRKLKSASKAVIWLPMREIEPNNVVIQRHRLIPSLLGLNQYHDLSQDVHCVIFDGVDEYLSKGPDGEHLIKLQDILRTLALNEIPVLISGRDFALGPHSIYRTFHSFLDDLCRDVTKGRQGPEQWELAEWKDSDSRRDILRQRLNDTLTKVEWQRCKAHFRGREREDVIAEQLDKVQQGVLTSPLLFGLATEAIADALRSHNETPRIHNTWELTQHWVQRCLHRDGARYSQPKRTDDITTRRRVAQRMALYLAISGKGISGIDWQGLEHNELQWIWRDLEENQPYRFSQRLNITNPDLSCRAMELMHCCLLRQTSATLAPFHQHILLHLAAEAFDTISTGQETIDLGASTAVINPVWEKLSLVLDREKLPHVGAIIERYIHASALNPGSEFDQCLKYLALYRQQQMSRSTPDYQLLHSRLFDPDQISAWQETNEILLSTGAAARIYEILAQNRLHDQPEAISFSNMTFNFVPAGSYYVWGVDLEGNAIPVLKEITAPFLLAQNLVTIEEYAIFLKENPHIEFPQHLEAEWRRQGGKIIYNVARAKEPVRGLSVRDAQRYCEWLTNKLQTSELRYGDDFMLVAFRLPSVAELRVAASGTDLRRGDWNERGPFGHVDLLCKVWQPTMDLEQSQHLVFGGSEHLGGFSASSSSESDMDEKQRRRNAQEVFEQIFRAGTDKLNPESHNLGLGLRIQGELTKDFVKTSEFGSAQSVTSGSPSLPDPSESANQQEVDDPDVLTLLAHQLSAIILPSDRIARILVVERDLSSDAFAPDVSAFQFWYAVLQQAAQETEMQTTIIELLDQLLDIARTQLQSALIVERLEELAVTWR